MVNVLVVDDSQIVRQILKEVLEEDPAIKVVNEATNGAEAVELCIKTSPDVVLMDVKMPVMDGLEAVKRIMAERPTPVIVLSATFQPGEIKATFAALNAGALDVLPKPRGMTSPRVYKAVADELIARVKLFARVGKKRGWTDPSKDETEIAPPVAVAASSSVICVGSSTGGPKALKKFLTPFPHDFPCPILVVQHMGHGFLAGFAQWLNQNVELEVVLVDRQMPIVPGKVYVSADGYHLQVEKGMTVMASSPPENGCRPSVDALFRSAAIEFGELAVGVVLTGMGKDGAEGAREIKKVGGKVFAQDEMSSVIYGMPKAVVESCEVDQELPIALLPAAVSAAVAADPNDLFVGDGSKGAMSTNEIIVGGSSAMEIEFGGAEVLIADDSPTSRAMLADILTEHGLNVREASDGEEALGIIRINRPDVVVLDIMMPKMDGIEVCREIRTQQDYLPVLMITSKADVKDMIEGLEAGADDYISKPFNEPELMARIKGLLRFRVIQQRLYIKNLEFEKKNLELERLTHELDMANKELRVLSVTDGLTGAFNHRHFQDILQAEFSRAVRHRLDLSCVMVDIDHFKEVNDTYGHQTGDGVLMRMVEIFKEEVRDEDMVARYGGEEFSILLPETSGQSARVLSERIRRRIEHTPMPAPYGKTVSVTVSIGISSFSPENETQTPDGLISSADGALYNAKENGRNQTVLI